MAGRPSAGDPQGRETHSLLVLLRPQDTATARARRAPGGPRRPQENREGGPSRGGRSSQREGSAWAPLRAPWRRTAKWPVGWAGQEKFLVPGRGGVSPDCPAPPRPRAAGPSQQHLRGQKGVVSWTELLGSLSPTGPALSQMGTQSQGVVVTSQVHSVGISPRSLSPRPPAWPSRPGRWGALGLHPTPALFPSQRCCSWAAAAGLDLGRQGVSGGSEDGGGSGSGAGVTSSAGRCPGALPLWALQVPGGQPLSGLCERNSLSPRGSHAPHRPPQGTGGLEKAPPRSPEMGRGQQPEIRLHVVSRVFCPAFSVEVFPSDLSPGAGFPGAAALAHLA